MAIGRRADAAYVSLIKREERDMASIHTSLGIVAGAALLVCAAALAPAQAQDYGVRWQTPPLYGVAPGYDKPDEEVIVTERELIQPFNNSPVTYNDQYDAPLNEFAGQRRNVERGIIGDALFSAKKSILGQ